MIEKICAIIVYIIITISLFSLLFASFLNPDGLSFPAYSTFSFSFFSTGNDIEEPDFLSSFYFQIIMVIILYLISLVIFKRLETTVNIVKIKPYSNIVKGILVIVSLNILINFTIVFPVFFSVMFYLPILIFYLSLIPSAIILGKKIKQLSKLNLNLKNSEVIIGSIALILIGLVPHIGNLISFIIGTLGLGAISSSRFGKTLARKTI